MIENVTSVENDKHCQRRRWYQLSLSWVVLSAVLFLFGCGGESNSSSKLAVDSARASETINTARQLLEAGQYDQAAESAARAIRLDPTQRIAYLYEGYAKFKRGASVESIKAFDEAVRLQPDDYQGFEYRAASYQAIKRFRRALADYRQALNLAPKQNCDLQSKLNKEMGMCLLSFGELDEAIAVLTRAINLTPKDSSLYTARATAQLHLERIEESMKDANEAVAIDPNNATARQVRSRIFVRLNDIESADREEAIARELFARASKPGLSK